MRCCDLSNNSAQQDRAIQDQNAQAVDTAWQASFSSSDVLSMRLMQEENTEPLRGRTVVTSSVESPDTSSTNIEDVRDQVEGPEAEFLSTSDLLCLYSMKNLP